MSIDTAAKRRSAACLKPFHKTPIPDGTIGVADREHIAWLYSGIPIVVIQILAIASTLSADLGIASTLSTDLAIASTLSSDLNIASTIEGGS